MSEPEPPPYRRIAAELRDRIRGGDLAPGEKLPSQHDLVATYGVARATTQAAIRLLQAEGLVATRRGAGAFVTDPAGWGEPVPPPVTARRPDDLAREDVAAAYDAIAAALDDVNRQVVKAHRILATQRRRLGLDDTQS